jgi:regulator of protease activity HflC (stomatin/prohibitin superfamily)
VDATIQADVTFNIPHPEEAFAKVKDFLGALKETVKAAYAAVAQELNFQEINSANISALAEKAGHQEPGHDKHVTLENTDTNNDVKFDAPESTTVGEGVNFFMKLKHLCEEWGVKIISFRIISVEARHADISKALELTAATRLNATAQALAATAKAKNLEIETAAEAQRIKTLAAAQAEAEKIRAEAAQQAAEQIANNPVAMQILKMQTDVRVAQGLGGGQGNFVLTANAAALFGQQANAADDQMAQEARQQQLLTAQARG